MTHGQVKLLVVDDEPPLLKMMTIYLGRLGYTVTAANTTEKALAAARAGAGDFACAVLDASMEGLSMRDLALELLGMNPNLCILAASGYPVDMADVEAQAPGRVSFIQKPFSPEMLAAAVRRMLAGQEQEL